MCAMRMVEIEQELAPRSRGRKVKAVVELGSKLIWGGMNEKHL